MTLKSILIAVIFIVSPQLYATNLFMLTKGPLIINQCMIRMTDNALDLALNGSGYFVVSRGKKNSELFFTRWGALFLNYQGYLSTAYGDYLLAMTDKFDPMRLSKIKIPTGNLVPKATGNIELGLTLPATEMKDGIYKTNIKIYDAIANEYDLELQLTKSTDNRWLVEVFADNKVAVDKGTLVFNKSGTLIKQEGLKHTQYPVNYGSNELNINFKGSTQHGQSFGVVSLYSDGYGLGTLQGLKITMDGEFTLLYSNGQTKMLNKRIAVAQFINPRYLELDKISHSYKPTEKSGQPIIHWVNGQNRIISGALEDETC